MLKVNNKVERLKTVKKLPTPKISVEWLKEEFWLLLEYMKSRKLKSEQRKTYRFFIPNDDVIHHKGISYQHSMQITFYWNENGEIKIEQLPANIWIFKNDYNEEYWLFRKGVITSGCGYIAKSYSDWKEVTMHNTWRYENFYYQDEAEKEKICLFKRIPEFKIFLKSMKKEKGISYWDFARSIISWNKEESSWIYKALENGWYNIYKQNLDRNAKTIHELLGFPKYISKKYISKVIDKYKGTTTFKLSYFKDAMEMMRKRDPEYKKFMYLFLESWSNVVNLHQHLTYIKEAKEKAEKKAKAKIKADYKKTFRETKYTIKLQKPKTKKDLKKIGNELKNCVGDALYKPKDIFVINYNDKKICVEYDWKNGTFIQISSYDNMELSNRIQKIVKETIRNYVMKGKCE